MEEALVDIEQIIAALAKGEQPYLMEELNKYLPSELIDIVYQIEEHPQYLILFFRCLDRENAYETFQELEIDYQEKLINLLPNRQLQLILNDMSPDKRTAMLEELPGDIINKILKLLTIKERAVALSLLGYPENSIGRLMTPDYIAVNENWTVAQVFEYLREHAEETESIDFIFVVNNQGKLLDDIALKKIMLADFDVQVHELMDEQFEALSVMEDETSAIEVFKRDDYLVLPVVDSNNILLGIVTADDVLQLAEEEDTEDIQKIGAVEALEDAYIDTPVHLMVRKRAVWLIILFLGELLTASAMAYFEDELSRAVVLALFVPLIVSSGGNSGSQAATLLIRAMALGEVHINDWWRIMRKEILSGLLLGTIIGIVGFLRVALWSSIFGLYDGYWLGLAFTIGFSVLGVVMWGTIVGSMLPLLLKRLGADPATSSAPFVATLVDVTGLLIYFTVATLFLTGTLL
ncbi:MAG TPA: magnesium transporter [Bacteroidia bacterium]|nr:magnesium transporter [Bacteroidia bacterium]